MGSGHQRLWPCKPHTAGGMLRVRTMVAVRGLVEEQLAVYVM